MAIPAVQIDFEFSDSTIKKHTEHKPHTKQTKKPHHGKYSIVMEKVCTEDVRIYSS